MLKAVIFDFDGVITDSEILHLRAFNKVLAQFNIEISTKDYYKKYLGLMDEDCFKLVAKKNRLGLDCRNIRDLMAQKNRIFEQLAKTEGRIIEGVHEFLRMLQRNSVPMAICSGALLAEIELTLEEARLRHFFSVIVSAEQIKKGKPDPEGFLLTLQRLNHGRQEPIRPEQCIVIEDSHWGLEAARAAGMHAIAVTNSYDASQLSLAEKIVDRLDELSIEQLRQFCV
jgi:beta-phosphoglucomutase family hydrolase